MPLQDLTSWLPRSGERVADGAVVARLAVGGEISPSLRAALAGADVVFCDEDADRSVVAWAAPRALVEFVPVAGGPECPRSLSIARARRLAGDGWRVVWVASANVDPLSDVERAGGSMTVGFPELVPVCAEAPHPLGTPFNGLAG